MSNQLYTLDEIEQVKNYLKSLLRGPVNPISVKIYIERCIDNIIYGTIDTKDSEKLVVDENLECAGRSFKIQIIDKNEITLIGKDVVNLYGECFFKKTNTPLFLIDNMLVTLDKVMSTDNDLKKLILSEKQFKPIIDRIKDDDFRNYLKNNVKNIKQEELILKTESLMISDDYFLLCWGPPGTGKTTCITEIIKRILKKYNDKKILITSFTNVAVDNVFKKLVTEIDDKTLVNKLLRLGDKHSIKIKEVLDITASKIEENHKIIGATLDKIGSMEYNYLEFDLVILDECSMIEFPKALAGLSKAKKFVMIGDPKQLPPIMKDSDELYEENHFLALFDRLIKKYEKTLCVQLNIQHRCAPSIIDFSNKNYYNNSIKNSNSKDYFNMLTKYNYFLNINEYNNLPEILKKILDPRINIIFIDTTKIFNYSFNSNYCPLCNTRIEDEDNNYFQKKKSCAKCGSWNSKYVNSLELVLSIAILDELINLLSKQDKNNFYWQNIGYISPFKDQVSAFRTLLMKHSINHPALANLSKDKTKWSDLDIIQQSQYIQELESSTVHKYQGREKEFIIFNLAHSSTRSAKLLSNPKLLNVALTRAKNKIIIIGNLNSNNTTPYNYLFEHLIDKKNSLAFEIDNNINQFKNIISEFKEVNKMIMNSEDKNIEKILPEIIIKDASVKDYIIKIRKYVLFYKNNNPGLFNFNDIEKHRKLLENYETTDVYKEIEIDKSLTLLDTSEKLEKIDSELTKFNVESYIYQSLLYKKYFLEINNSKDKNSIEIIDLITNMNKNLLYNHIKIPNFVKSSLKEVEITVTRNDYSINESINHQNRESRDDFIRRLIKQQIIEEPKQKIDPIKEYNQLLRKIEEINDDIKFIDIKIRDSKEEDKTEREKFKEELLKELSTLNSQLNAQKLIKEEYEKNNQTSSIFSKHTKIKFR